MGAIDELLDANREYAASFSHGELQAPPRRRLAVVTCMDARIVPARILGLREGDAHVIRNAGGSAREALRSLAVSQHLLGTNEIALIRHTDCGMKGMSNAEMQQKVAAASGADTSEIDFEPYDDLDEALRADMRLLESSPLIASGTAIRGFVYEVETGRLREVVS
jgi:carbonic anhydrase